MADEDLTISLGADTSGLDVAEQEQLRFLDRYNQHVRDAAAQTPELTARVNVDDLGRFRQELQAAAGDAQRTRQIFTGFAQGVDTELRALGVTGPEAARVINLVWTETVRAAAAADAAQVPIASLASGLQNIRGFLPSGPTRFELGAGSQAEEVRRLASGLQDVESRLGTIRRLTTELRNQPLLPATPVVAGLLGPGTPAQPTTPTLLGSREQTEAAQSTDANARATSGLITQLDRAQGRFISVNREIRETASGSDKMAAGIALAGRATDQGAESFGKHEQSTRRATNAIAAMAAGSIGAEGPVARLAEAALIFSGGEALVAGTAVAVLGLAAAFRFVTTPQRELEESQARYVAGLRAEATSAIPQAIQAVQALAAAREEERRARQGLVSRGAETAATVITTLADPARLGVALTTEVTRRNAEAETQAARDKQQAQDGVTRSVREFQALNVRTLTESIQMHTADADQIRTASGLVQILRQQEQEVNRPTAERNELRRQELALLDAINQKALQQVLQGNARQRTQDELAATQQGLAAREAAERASFQRGEQTLAEFSARRREILRQQAGADIAALQSQLRQTAISPARTDEEFAARAGQVESLRNQITLRRNVRDQQLEAVRNEERLNDALVRQAQLLAEVERRGGGNRVAGFGGVGNVPTNAQDLSPETFGVRDQGITVDIPVILRPALQRESRDIGVEAHRAAEIMVQEFDRARDRADRLAQGIAGIGHALGGLAGDAGAAISQIADLGAGLFQVTQAGRDISKAKTDLANTAVGTPEHDRALQDLQSGQLAQLTGQIALLQQGIGLVGGLLSSVLGQSEAERLQVEATRDNSRRLAELSQELHNNVRGIGGVQRAGEAAARLALGGDESLGARARSVQLTEQFSLGRDAANKAGIDFINQNLAQFGLNFEDLNRIAKDNGIQLLDKNGRIVASAFEDIAKAAGISIESLTSFTNTFDEQQRKLDLGSRLRGEPQDERSKFDRELQAASAVAPAVADAFRGVDTKNEEAVRRASVGLFDKFDQGFFTAHPEQLGGLSKEDFLRLLDDSAGFLDTFNQGLKDATRNLQNVPDITSLAELEFQARGPQNRPGDGASLPLPDLPRAGEGPLGPRRTELSLPLPGSDFTAASRIADPITARLADLSGGASLQDMLDVLLGKVPQATPTGTTQTGTPATAGRATINVYGPITVRVDGVPDDPSETAKRVKGVFEQELLAVGDKEAG